ncbi:hypothetical protein CUU_2194 [Phocaeicola vulgatus PC510]|uniref:Uncharacterized protein n=1 Tax=Phocaeicola vulgatus PC510 TaxID=702446 RepID=D4VBE4_PHOVU|nr:hypothetical protein CUU_2194 [Phocaeicola vulgatus PC510]
MREKRPAIHNIIEELKRLPDDIPLFPSCRMWQEGNKGDF